MTQPGLIRPPSVAARSAFEPASAPPTADGRRAAGAALESVWTEVDGQRMHARVALRGASADARDVVLVHGFGASSRYMIPLALELARDFRVHAPDLPGFGLSARPDAALDVPGLAAALLGWLDRRGIARSVLVADSFGGHVAAEALAQRPARFDRAVLQGPQLDRRAGPAVERAARWLTPRLHAPLPLYAVRARDQLDCGPSRALASVRHALTHAFLERLALIPVPALIVRGTGDTVTSQRWARRVAQVLPRGELLVLPGATHTLTFSAAPQLGAVVRRFLGTPARRRAGPHRRPGDSIATFDSASAMVRASARTLHGHGMDGLGWVPRRLAPPAELVVAQVNALPRALRQTVYRYASGAEGIPAERLHTVSAEAVARWMTGCFPRGRRYPAAVIGSSSGAAVHLAAALGVPFLPQTMLVPVRQPEVSPEHPARGMQAGRGPAQLLLDANPELQLHHMHDPNQDRLTLARMAYFRVKRLRLGEAFERFLTDSLLPGATLFVADCRLRWPVTHVGDRHVFQLGALGGMDAEEFQRRWEAPVPDADAPEAEWGFEPALLGDLREIALRRGLRLRRIVFDDPEDLSPLVADLHRWWYRRRGRDPARLLVESFVLLDPWRAIRTGSVPLWLKFGVESSAALLERYLAEAEPYPDVRQVLFSHGTEGVGVTPIERWRELLRRTGGHAAFLGVDERRFPQDFASFARFGRELRGLSEQGPAPSALTLAELDEFLALRGGADPVSWGEG